MSSLVVQIFDSAESAAAAAAKLRAAGFPEDAVTTVSPGSADAVANALAVGPKLGHLGPFYAERVRQGRSLVGVAAQFGRAQTAKQILIEAGSVDRELALPEDPDKEAWGEGAPFSEALGWRVLSTNDPTPLSDSLQLGVKSRTTYFLTSGLGDPHRFLGRMFGALLGGGAAPLSSKFGMATLSSKAAPLSSAVGLKLLSAGRPKADVSSWSRNPAPFSSALGLPLLTAHR